MSQKRSEMHREYISCLTLNTSKKSYNKQRINRDTLLKQQEQSIDAETQLMLQLNLKDYGKYVNKLNNIIILNQSMQSYHYSHKTKIK